MRLLAFLSRKVALIGRIKDLERTIESLQGANNILERELERSNQERERLLNKVFDITGINRVPRQQEQPPQNNNVDFKMMARGGLPWAKVRENLEAKARSEKDAYWIAKQKEQDDKIKAGQAGQTGEEGIKEDANKIS